MRRTVSLDKRTKKLCKLPLELRLAEPAERAVSSSRCKACRKPCISGYGAHICCKLIHLSIIVATYTVKKRRVLSSSCSKVPPTPDARTTRPKAAASRVERPQVSPPRFELLT